jgi:hypothetical protein
MGVCTPPLFALSSHPEYSRTPSRTSAAAIIRCHSPLQTTARLHVAVSSEILRYPRASARLHVAVACLRCRRSPAGSKSERKHCHHVSLASTYARTAARCCLLRCRRSMGVCKPPLFASSSHPEYSRTPSRTSAAAIVRCHSPLQTTARLHVAVSSEILRYPGASARLHVAVACLRCRRSPAGSKSERNNSHHVSLASTYASTAARRRGFRDPQIPSSVCTAAGCCSSPQMPT